MTVRMISILVRINSSVSSSSSSASSLGARTGRRKLARSSVHTITPEAKKIMSDRCGKVDPSARRNGMVKAIESVIAPLGPPTVVTSESFTMLKLNLSRFPVSGFLMRRVMISAQTKRSTTIRAVNKRTYPIKTKLSIYKLSQVLCMALGS